jgi:protocatechuate 3,4-dioxygenase beta subunit
MPLQRLSLTFARALAGLLLLVPLSAHAQTSPATAKPTGTISGKVTLNGKGAPDVLVAAQLLDRPFQQPAARAKSDANGRYRLTGLPAGQYQIMGIAPAFVSSEGSGSPGYRFGKSVVLASGEDADDVDIKIVQGGVITGRVTDADGKPVIEERINLQMIDQAGNTNNQSSIGSWNYQMSQTDDRGIYRIYGLPAGRYRVSVGSTDGGFMMSRNRTYYPVTFYGNTSEAAKASVVELQEGTEATNIDIRVGRATSTFIAGGRIIDENGQPIPGIRLSYGPARVGQPFYGGFIGLPTGTRGEFRLEGLEPGRYMVSVSTSFESATHYSEPLGFEIVDADVLNLELKVTRGQTLSGVVVFEGSRAKELQQNFGVLRVGANVTSPANPQNPSSSSAPIAADGSFQLSGLRPGKALLYIGAMSTSALRGITLLRAERGGVDVTQTLEVHAGESITDLRIVASLGAGSIRGTVRFVGGEVPPNLRLFVSTRRDGAPQSGGGMVDARGRFLIGGLTSGTYEVGLIMNSLGPPGGVRPTKPQTQTVTVSDGVETQVDFVVDLTPKEGGP